MQNRPDQQRKRITLFKSANEKSKNMDEKAHAALDAHLAKSQSNRTVGDAYSEGDCFFDGIAQELAGIDLKKIHALKNKTNLTHKDLRMMCSDYANRLDKAVGKENWIKDAIITEKNDPKLIAIQAENYKKYLTNIQYAFGESTEVPICGRPDIEGRILCELLNIKLHIVEIIKDEDNIVISHQLVDGKKSIQLDEKTALSLYADNRTVHLVVYAGTNHFVPLRKNLPENTIIQAATSSDIKSDVKSQHTAFKPNTDLMSVFSAEREAKLKKEKQSLLDGVKKEDAESLFKYGQALLKGDFNFKPDTNLALDQFKLSAKKGYAPAYETLERYYTAESKIIDPKLSPADQMNRKEQFEIQAFHYLTLAYKAANPSIEVQLKYAKRHMQGRGTNKDLKKGAQLSLEIAKRTNDPEAYYSLGYCYESAMGDLKGCFQYFLAGAQAPQKPTSTGNCQANVAQIFEDISGVYGVPHDMEKAIYWYQKAIEHNNTIAYYQMANLLKKEDVRSKGKLLLKKDIALSNKYYEKSAADVPDAAIISTVNAIEEKSFNKAAQYFKLAYDKKSNEVLASPLWKKKENIDLAFVNFIVCLEHGYGIPKNKEMAVILKKQAKNIGINFRGIECFLLGLRFEKGDGEKISLERTEEYYRYSKNNNYSPAIDAWDSIDKLIKSKLGITNNKQQQQNRQPIKLIQENKSDSAVTKPKVNVDTESQANARKIWLEFEAKQQKLHAASKGKPVTSAAPIDFPKAPKPGTQEFYELGLADKAEADALQKAIEEMQAEDRAKERRQKGEKLGWQSQFATPNAAKERADIEAATQASLETKDTKANESFTGIVALTHQQASLIAKKEREQAAKTAQTKEDKTEQAKREKAQIQTAIQASLATPKVDKPKVYGGEGKGYTTTSEAKSRAVTKWTSADLKPKETATNKAAVGTLFSTPPKGKNDAADAKTTAKNNVHGSAPATQPAATEEDDELAKVLALSKNMTDALTMELPALPNERALTPPPLAEEVDEELKKALALSLSADDELAKALAASEEEEAARQATPNNRKK